MSSLKKLASETVIYGMSTMLMRMLNYLLVPLYTRLFHPEAYGVVTILYAVMAFMNIFLTYGMETTYFRYASDKGEKVYSTALNSIILSSLIFLGIAWPQTHSIAGLLRLEGNEKLIEYSLFILILDAISALPFARLRKEGKAKRFAILRSLNILLNVLFNLLFILWIPEWVQGGWNPLGLFSAEPQIAYIFVSNLLASALTCIFLIPEIRGLEAGFDFSLWQTMMRYALPLVLVGFAGMINETFDRVILQYLLPEDIAKEQIGIYGACYKLSILITLFIQAYRFAAEPFFFAQKDRGDRSIYARATHYFTLFCFVIFLMVTLYLDLFKLLIGEEFWAGIQVVPILLLANLFLGVYYNLSTWYKLADKTMIGAYISVGGAMLTIGLLLTLIPLMGYLGAAWATLAVYASMMVAGYITGQKYYPIPYKVRSFLFYLIFTLFLFIVSEMMNEIQSPALRYTWKSILFLSFLVVVALSEKRGKILTSQQNPRDFDPNKSHK
ncbi:MAG: oligosaccharide flippase family protein [Bacteroidetes bacterium]|nr:oligosaccharide flippase family protein [Bacteroidota bacterium]